MPCIQIDVSTQTIHDTQSSTKIRPTPGHYNIPELPDKDILPVSLPEMPTKAPIPPARVKKEYLLLAAVIIVLVAIYILKR